MYVEVKSLGWRYMHGPPNKTINNKLIMYVLYYVSEIRTNNYSFSPLCHSAVPAIPFCHTAPAPVVQ